MVEVYRVPLFSRYYASRCSFSWFAKIAYYIILIIVPVYVAYSSGSFYKTFDTYREQPNTRFDRQMIVVGSGSLGQTANLQTPILWSTFPAFNALFPSSSITQPLSVKSSFIDSNADSIPDEWFGELEFPLTGASPVQAIKIGFLFSAQITSKLDIKFNSLIPISTETGLVGGGVDIGGDLLIHQTAPFAYQASRTAFNSPAIKNSQFVTIEDADINSIFINSQLNRNESLELSNPHIYWRHSSSPGPSSFKITYRFRIPISNRIQYHPGAAEVIKFAYIQWLAMFWFIWFFLSWMRDFLYRNKILQSSNVKDSQMKIKMHQF